VSADEKETSDQRIILNYGHTVGHAIESSTNYRHYLHGEAISIGMTVAANISAAIGLIDAIIVNKQTLLLEAFNLPTKAADLELDIIYSNMFRDKKIVNGKIRWVLLQDIGKTQLCDTVDENVVKQAIQLSL
jgi:3-dehydroquinate synthase